MIMNIYLMCTIFTRIWLHLLTLISSSEKRNIIINLVFCVLKNNVPLHQFITPFKLFIVNKLVEHRKCMMMFGIISDTLIRITERCSLDRNFAYEKKKPHKWDEKRNIKINVFEFFNELYIIRRMLSYNKIAMKNKFHKYIFE